MNLWFRLIWMLLTSGLRPRLHLPGGTSAVRFRVWPNDLDLMRHMNNGRYLTLMDLGRTDLMLCSGLWRVALANKWTPIASAVVIRFRREIRLFQAFRLETRIAYWDDSRAVIEQVFVLDGGRHDGQVAARALFKGGLYDRRAKAFVPIAHVMAAIGIQSESPPLTDDVAALLASDAALQAAPRPAARQNT